MPLPSLGMDFIKLLWSWVSPEEDSWGVSSQDALPLGWLASGTPPLHRICSAVTCRDGSSTSSVPTFQSAFWSLLLVSMSSTCAGDPSMG